MPKIIRLRNSLGHNISAIQNLINYQKHFPRKDVAFGDIWKKPGCPEKEKATGLEQGGFVVSVANK
jgi:hypothetical protein